jgi:hypothetical protein
MGVGGMAGSRAFDGRLARGGFVLLGKGRRRFRFGNDKQKGKGEIQGSFALLRMTKGVDVRARAQG